MAGLPPPQRKEKPQLTLIPEQERSVDYRFEFAIVNESAKIFAERAVRSEMAESFRPTAKKDEEHWDEPKNEKSSDFKSTGSGSDGMAMDRRKTDSKKLVLFCPVGDASRALARIRFSCVQCFSDSLPLSRAPEIAQNQAVIFLFCPSLSEGSRTPRTPSKSPVEEFKTDFMNRYAEINHQPKGCKPLSVILSMEAAEADQEQLEEFAKSKSMVIDSHPDSGEDTVMEAIQAVCEYLVEAQKRIERDSARGSNNGDTAPPAPSEKSRLCVML
jgi:hypothetical protein